MFARYSASILIVLSGAALADTADQYPATVLGSRASTVAKWIGAVLCTRHGVGIGCLPDRDRVPLHSLRHPCSISKSS